MLLKSHIRSKVVLLKLCSLFLAGCIVVACTSKTNNMLAGTQIFNQIMTQVSKSPTITKTLTTRESLPTSTISLTSTYTHNSTKTPASSDLSGYVVFDWLDNSDDLISQIFIANLDSHEIAQLTYTGSNFSPAWSPDGKQIAFVSSRDGNFNLYIMNSNGNNQQQITDFEGDELQPDWSPDGRKIVFVSNLDGNKEIYTIDITTSEINRLTYHSETDFSPKWSPDGKYIAYVLFKKENDIYQTFQIYLMQTDGSGIEQITDDDFLNGNPAWCPDSTCIVYERYTGSRSNVPKLMVINLVNKEVSPLLKGAHATSAEVHEWNPSISHRRKYINFAIGDMLYAFDIKTDYLYSLGLQAINAALFP